MAFDSSRGRVILFGGYDGSNLLGDTWEYNGAEWMQISTAHTPPGRYDSAMAFDEAQGRIVLFGGYSAGQQGLNNTWERYDSAMVFDEAQGHIVPFEGSGAGQRVNDTWEYDGSDWMEVIPTESPPSRYDHDLAYDSARNRTVLFSGGYWDSGVSEWVLFEDTWEYERKITPGPTSTPTAIPTSTATPTSTPTATPTSTPTPTATPTIPWLNWRDPDRSLLLPSRGATVDVVYGNIPTPATLTANLSGLAVFADSSQMLTANITSPNGTYALQLKPAAEAAPGNPFTLEVTLSSLRLERVGTIAWEVYLPLVRKEIR